MGQCGRGWGRVGGGGRGWVWVSHSASACLPVFWNASCCPASSPPTWGPHHTHPWVVGGPAGGVGKGGRGLGRGWTVVEEGGFAQAVGKKCGGGEQGTLAPANERHRQAQAAFVFWRLGIVPGRRVPPRAGGGGARA